MDHRGQNDFPPAAHLVWISQHWLILAKFEDNVGEKFQKPVLKVASNWRNPPIWHHLPLVYYMYFRVSQLCVNVRKRLENRVPTTNDNLYKIVCTRFPNHLQTGWNRMQTPETVWNRLRTGLNRLRTCFYPFANAGNGSQTGLDRLQTLEKACRRFVSEHAGAPKALGRKRSRKRSSKSGPRTFPKVADCDLKNLWLGTTHTQVCGLGKIYWQPFMYMETFNYRHNLL